LGASGIALGPIFASRTHGYDTADHYRIDPRLGDDEDFDYVIDQARRRGLRVLLDGVFNHVGTGFSRYREVTENPGSPAADWFIKQGSGFRTFEGHSDLITLNHASAAVIGYVIDVMDHWLARGADGWRLDAAYAMPDSFWASVIPVVRSRHRNAWFVGEVIHGDYVAIAREAGLDSVTQYELWKAIWSSLNDRNFFELAWALDRHNGFAEAFTPLTFVGNHDVTRIATQITDERHLAHALAILFTVAGVPSIYAGDEQAFRGVKYDRAGGDEEIRPAFPDGPDGLAPDGWPVYRLHQDLIGLRRRHPWLVHARTQVRHLENEALAYTSAAPGGGPGLAVLLNLSDRAVTFPPAGLAGKRILASEDSGGGERVEPDGWAVLELDG
jgi:glycosidase